MQHCKTLGLPDEAPAKLEVHKAYRRAALQWHPDRFEREPERQGEAEERFKKVQVAYRELSEHFEHPAEFLDPVTFTRPVEQPPFNFGDLPGCFTAPHFPPYVERIVRDHLGVGYNALGIVDLAPAGSSGGHFSQFLFLTSHAVIVRNHMKIVSLLWYSDLGEVILSDRRKGGIMSFWQRLAERITGPRPQYLLRITRRNGRDFCVLAGHADDSVKKVIYNFLLRKKYQTHP